MCRSAVLRAAPRLRGLRVRVAARVRNSERAGPERSPCVAMRYALRHALSTGGPRPARAGPACCRRRFGAPPSDGAAGAVVGRAATLQVLPLAADPELAAPQSFTRNSARLAGLASLGFAPPLLACTASAAAFSPPCEGLRGPESRGRSCSRQQMGPIWSGRRRRARQQPGSSGPLSLGAASAIFQPGDFIDSPNPRPSASLV